MIQCHNCKYFCVKKNKNPHSLACGVFYCKLELPMYTLSCEKFRKNMKYTKKKGGVKGCMK